MKQPRRQNNHPIHFDRMKLKSLWTIKKNFAQIAREQTDDDSAKLVQFFVQFTMHLHFNSNCRHHFLPFNSRIRRLQNAFKRLKSVFVYVTATFESKVDSNAVQAKNSDSDFLVFTRVDNSIYQPHKRNMHKKVHEKSVSVCVCVSAAKCRGNIRLVSYVHREFVFSHNVNRNPPERRGNLVRLHSEQK